MQPKFFDSAVASWRWVRKMLSLLDRCCAGLLVSLLLAAVYCAHESSLVQREGASAKAAQTSQKPPVLPEFCEGLKPENDEGLITTRILPEAPTAVSDSHFVPLQLVEVPHFRPIEAPTLPQLGSMIQLQV